MKLIKPSYEIIPQDSTLDGIYKHIELCGRIAYKSEDKITEDSAKKFVEKLINLKHLSPLEHGTCYLRIPRQEWIFFNTNNSIFNEKCLWSNPYSKIIFKDEMVYITIDYRKIVENNWFFYLKEYLYEPTKYHEKRITVRLILDRAIAMEFLRHRKFSFTMESTRYCNYSRDRFGNELTFIIPSWLPWDEQIIYKEDFEKSGSGSIDSSIFINFLLDSESSYKNLLKEGWKPQQARVVLPNALKTELIMTGFVEDWKHFFNLRCNSSAHPQAQELAIPLLEEFNKRNLLT